MNEVAQRFTSRKFILSTLSFGFAVLAALGIVPDAKVQGDIALAAPVVFILVEGLADLASRRQLTAQNAATVAAEAAMTAVRALGAPNTLATKPAPAEAPLAVASAGPAVPAPPAPPAA